MPKNILLTSATREITLLTRRGKCMHVPCDLIRFVSWCHRKKLLQILHALLQNISLNKNLIVWQAINCNTGTKIWPYVNVYVIWILVRKLCISLFHSDWLCLMSKAGIKNSSTWLKTQLYWMRVRILNLITGSMRAFGAFYIIQLTTKAMQLMTRLHN